MIPCKECLVLSMCKGRPYLKLVAKCSILNSVLYKKKNICTTTRKPGFNTNIIKLEKIMGTRLGGALMTKQDRLIAWRTVQRKELLGIRDDL